MCLLSPSHKQRMVSSAFFSPSYSSLSISCGSNEKNLHEICLKHFTPFRGPYTICNMDLKIWGCWQQGKCCSKLKVNWWFFNLHCSYSNLLTWPKVCKLSWSWISKSLNYPGSERERRFLLLLVHIYVLYKTWIWTFSHCNHVTVNIKWYNFEVTFFHKPCKHNSHPFYRMCQNLCLIDVDR